MMLQCCSTVKCSCQDKDPGTKGSQSLADQNQKGATQGQARQSVLRLLVPLFQSTWYQDLDNRQTDKDEEKRGWQKLMQKVEKLTGDKIQNLQYLLNGPPAFTIT